MKAVILAGGRGTRLFPLTISTSKQLLPIGGKPMIYYPISLAMLSGIKDILIISQKEIIPEYQKVLSDGSHLGINISYKIQDEPIGLANGVFLAKEFVGKDNFLFMLGDNIIHGHGLIKDIKESLLQKDVTMFSYWIQNPRDFGVIEFDDNNLITKLVEKPKNPASNWISIGLYTFPNEIFKYYETLRPSHRGEFEIPDLVSDYINDNNQANVTRLGRGFVWFDAGSHSNYIRANNYINVQEDSSQSKVACIEEIAYRNGWLNKQQIAAIIEGSKGEYNDYLRKVMNEED